MMIIILKLLMFIVLAILLLFIVLTILDRTVFKRTPESALKTTFNIHLKNFDYTVETFKDQMHPLGEGDVFVIYNFNKLTQENIDYLKKIAFKPLPISEEDSNLMWFNSIPDEYFNVNTGYYIYEPLSTPAIRVNYKVFVVDTVKKKAVLYYQYM